MLVANNWNVLQYAVLLHMFAQVSGFDVGELVHVIADAHIYDRHIEIVKEMESYTQYDNVKFEIDKSITNFYDFTVDSFNFIDYKSDNVIKSIPVAI